MSGVIVACLIGTGLLIIWSAWHGYRKTNNSSDYLVAGRAAPWWLITGSLLAATVSGATFFGLISSYNRQGFYTHWIPLGVAFSWLVICFAVGPRLRRYGGFTIPEYLAERFNSPALRPAFSVVTVFWMVFLLGSVVVQGGLLFESLWDWPYAVSVVAITILIAAYTFIGGQKAVMYTDFVQMIVFLLAVAVVVPITLSVAGGWNNVAETVSVNQPGFFTPTGGVMTAVNAAALFFIWFLGYLGHPGFLTRFYTARSERDVIKTGIAVSAVYLPFWALIGLAGISMRVIFPNAADSEILWLRFVLEFTPAIIAGLLLSGILASILSTADTWLLTAASSLTHDLARRFSRKEMDDARLMRWTRWAVALLAILALPIGLWRPTYITEMMNIAYTIAGASGGLIIILSLYWRRMTRAGAWSGLIFGALTSVVGRLLEASGNAPSWFDPVLPTLLATVVVIVVVSLITPSDPAATSVFDRLSSRAKAESTDALPAQPAGGEVAGPTKKGQDRP